MNVVPKSKKYRTEKYPQVKERALRASEVLERALNGGIVIDSSVRDAGTGVDLIRSRYHLVIANAGTAYQKDLSGRV